ncbi:MAG: YtxH domain-containing protein [Coriobacteriia bacterium]|nr:YtxH domain-containing protein [Coriobacteriia bacterium]
MQDYRRGGGVLGAFLLGGLIGGALGLLFAPRSGKDTRDMLAEGVDKYWSEGKDLYDTGVHKVTEVYESGREVATDKTEELRGKIDAARDRLKEQVEGVSDTARTKVAEVAPAAKEVVGRAADGVRTGLDVAEKKAQDTLDLVADKVAKKPEDSAVTFDEIPAVPRV